MIRTRALAILSAASFTGFSAGDGAAAAQPPAAAASPTAPVAAQDDRRILVMLHLPAQHYRPGADDGAGGGDGDAPAAEARSRLATRLARENGLQLVGDWPMPILG